MIADNANKVAKRTKRFLEKESGEKYNALPENSQVVAWRGSKDAGQTFEFIYVVYPEGKWVHWITDWTKVIKPSTSQLVLRLKNMPFLGFPPLVIYYWGQEWFDNKTASPMFDDYLNQKNPTDLWVIWTGKGFRDMLTGKPL